MYLFQPFHHNTETRSNGSKRSSCPIPSQPHLFQTFQQFQSFQTLKIGGSDPGLASISQLSCLGSQSERRTCRADLIADEHARVGGRSFRAGALPLRREIGEPRQEDEAAGKSFWTFSSAHANLPEDLRV
jgi:hypothetical protein